MYFELLLIFLLSEFVASEINPLSDEFIDRINNQGKWKAGRNFHPSTPLEHIKRLLGAKLVSTSSLPTQKHYTEVIANLPDSFDPRDKWPNCPSLIEIRDQGCCGSCWAFGAVAAMTDRVCIHSNGTKNFHFSAQDLVACDQLNRGCDGGDPKNAWNYWKSVGIVSGGNYNSKQGCRPYTFSPSYDNSDKLVCSNDLPTPTCEKTCVDGYNVTYEKDLRRGKRTYAIDSDEKQIMAELYTNGPVEAVFIVYEDFPVYKGGVYRDPQGFIVGVHAVKIMGWGIEGDVKYWLIANSWNEHWGDKGYFKFLRGENLCGIESYVVAGEPLLDEY